MTTVYRTATREHAKRFRYWSALMCRTFAPAHGSVEDADDFDARFTVSELGATTVCTVSAPKQFWERTRQHVRRAPRDEFLFTQLLSGRGVLRQGSAELILHPGTMSVYDVNRPYSYEVGGEVVFVKLPRRPLLDRLGMKAPTCATAIEADSALRQWVSGLVCQAATLDHLSGAHTADCVGNSVISAVSSLLHAAPGASVAQAAMDAPLLARVCAYIESRIGEPQLSPAAIARAQCLSERSLHRLFAQIGTTPMRWVLQQRLRLSRRALEQDRRARITDVAFSYGFNDLSHFSRVFKKAFSMSPGQLAAAARTGFPSH